MISSTKFISKCLDSGRSATPQRMLIIDELDTSKKNLSAYELLGILNDKGHSFNISTIYRVLDFWIEMGVVHKMDSSNTYLICNDSHTNHFHVLLHCSNCKSVEESCQVSAQLSLPKSNKFRVNGGQVIEFHGFCKNCR
ncbi:MAG: Fur family zinc uptake transcriptional regulator [Brevundimonas sp.]|mgnify:CR=1 FL=1|jgi:Fur family zinc uptake transcriptional regulator|tara:strand:+ start:522 stop:938 length:417 start_codon:yes stop_codon:yes gene_type:complete